MKRRISGLTLGMVAAAGLWAHDARLHQANAVTGDVVAMGADSFDLKTAKGTVKVTLNAKTKFEDAGKAADRSRLGKGARIGVIGTKLPSGELVAKEVLLNVADTSRGAAPKAAAPAAHAKH